MNHEVQQAIDQLSAQHEFLLRNTWVKGEPSAKVLGSNQDNADIKAAGCLRVRSCATKVDEGTGQVMQDDRDEVNHPIAVRALVWTLMESGYEVPGVGIGMTPEDWDQQEFWDTCLSHEVEYVNDSQFTSAGEAIEVLERSIRNIKSAFGQE